VTDDRDLDWDGCYNVRDLGGLATVDGRLTRRHALVRADAPSALTEAGWSAVWDHGIRTVIDLVEDHERAPDTSPRPDGLREVRVPLDGTDDEEFWAPLRANGHWGTVLYYRPYLKRFPHRIGSAVRAFADAPPGGVLVHCGRGRDRTGMLCMILLSLAGVCAADIADDYTRSDSERVMRLRQELGLARDNTTDEQIYGAAGTTAADAVADVIASLDAGAILTAGGLTAEEITRARTRLLD